MKQNIRHILALVLTIAAAMAGHETAQASTFTLYDMGDGYFSVFRDNADYAETINFRTVSLSAIQGQHFNALSGSYTFPAGEYDHTFVVSTRTPDSYYKYQSGTTRSYRFEITDRGGYVLASTDQNITTGIDANNYTNALTEQDITVRSGEITVTDDNYSQAYHAVPIENFFSATAPRPYLQSIGAQLRMTLSFDAKEVNDGYQHVQILVDNTTNHDEGSGDNNPGNINYSHYMACFVHQGGSYNGNYASYSFPVTSYGDQCGTVYNAWSSLGNTIGELREQKFNPNISQCRAIDGRLIIPTDLTTLGIRFDASGNNEDTWTAKNAVAHIQAVDATRPEQQGDIILAPGRHAKGNVAYISIPFSETVIVTGENELRLYSTWCTFKYLTGSGTNVLTFSGTITADAGTELALGGMNNNYTGTNTPYLADLVGNKSWSSPNNTFYGVTVDEALATLGDFSRDAKGNYLISTIADLRELASYVKAGNDCTDITFLQTNDIANVGTTIPIGVNDDRTFNGTYDGGGYSISGITINGNSENGDHGYVGLFGITGANAVIKNVWLKSCTIKGQDFTGGIVGFNKGIVRNCLVESSVTVACYTTSAACTYSHGGIAGNCYHNAVIEGCRSAAKLTLTTGNNKTMQSFGGIVGSIYGGAKLHAVRDCLYTGGSFGTNFSGNSYGAITGEEATCNVSNNYYTINNYQAVGWASGDVDGARKGRIIRLPEGVSIAADATTYDVSGITAYDDVAIAYDGNIYSGATQVITLNYDGGGETFTMPDYNTTPLLNGFDNTAAIDAANGKTRNVVLTGRTLYRDGAWNTLCLPFDLVLDGSVLEGAEARTLSSASFSGGTLTLNFTEPVETLVCGTPYIIKWAEGTNIVNPVFAGVSVSTQVNDFVDAEAGVSFKGTYTSTTFDAIDKSILYMGSGNTLRYPGVGASIGAFRAYFEIEAEAGEVKQFVLNFGDDDPTAVNDIRAIDDLEGSWYTIDGKRLSGSPHRKGLYIRNGRKTIIK